MICWNMAAIGRICHQNVAMVDVCSYQPSLLPMNYEERQGSIAHPLPFLFYISSVSHNLCVLSDFIIFIVEFFFGYINYYLFFQFK